MTENEDQIKGFFESQGKLKDTQDPILTDKISPLETSLD